MTVSQYQGWDSLPVAGVGTSNIRLIHVKPASARISSEFAAKRQVLLVHHSVSQTPIDIAFAWLPFELESLRRAETVNLAGVAVRIATVEDLIVSKFVAWRSRDRDDIERLLVVHRDAIDLNPVLSQVREFAELLEEPERLDDFSSLVERAGGCRPPDHE